MIRGRPLGNWPLKARHIYQTDFTPVGPMGCWLWTGSKTTSGYGNLRANDGRVQRAHRIAYELFVGEIPFGLHVLHTCDNPSCVNPAHLFLGTHDDNMADKKTKGRHRGPRGEQHPLAKIHENDLAEIHRLHRSGWTKQSIGERFNVNRSLIGRILKGQSWRAAQQELGLLQETAK